MGAMESGLMAAGEMDGGGMAGEEQALGSGSVKCPLFALFFLCDCIAHKTQ